MKILKLTQVLLTGAFVFYSSSSFADFLSGLLAYHKKDYSTAYSEFNALAKKGDAAGQGMLGKLYYEGNGVPQDYRMAAALYEKSANQGDFSSQLELGKMLFEGVGIEKNHFLAAASFEKAATKGYIVAMYYVGILYMRGDGVELDKVQAHKWFNLVSSYPVSEITSEYIRLSKEARFTIEAEMTADQILEAQSLATKWHIAKKINDDALMRKIEKDFSKVK